MWNKELTPPIKKGKHQPVSYLSGYAKSEWSVIHFGLDKLEIRFDVCSNTIIELAKYSKGHRWTVGFRFNQNSKIEYECYFAVTWSTGYIKGLSVGHHFKGQDNELFFISFAKANSSYPSKVRINGTMFRYCKIDGFELSPKDILEFFEKHFKDPKVFQFDICADIKVDRKTADAGFLSDILKDINERRFGSSDETKRVRGTKLNIYTDRLLNVRTLYDGDEDEEVNDKYLLRIYDKTYHIEKYSELRPLYSAYLDLLPETRIFRFEMAFRKKAAKDLLVYQDAKDPIKVWGLLLTQLSKRQISIFDGMEFERVKNIKDKSTLGWWDVYKIEKMKLQHRLKSTITGMNKLFAEWIDPVEIRRKQIEGTNLIDGRREEFVFYYENILNTTIAFLKNGNCRYQDFTREIEGHIDIIEKSVQISYADFILIVNGFIRPSLELLAKEQYKSLILMAYFLYRRKIPIWNDKVLHFLRIFDEEKIMDFSEKYLKAEIKKLNSSKSVQFIYKQIDANGLENPKNKDFIISLLQKVSEVNNYS